MLHAKWATTDANTRSRASSQMFNYLIGRLPRLPPTVIEVYGKMVDQWLECVADLNRALEKKVSSTHQSVESLRSESSVNTYD